MNSQYLQIDSIHIFIWLFFMYFLSKCIDMQRDDLIHGKEVEVYTPLYAVLIFLPILIMAVYGRPRSDTILYLRNFRNLPSELEAGWETVAGSERPGFTLFGVAVKLLFGPDETAYRMAIALVHALPVVFVLRRYSENYLFSIYMFVASGMHLSWMMNGLRQFMAVTIVFAATPWIIEKKYLRVILVILLAASFHKTALFMIPVVFITRGKIWNRKTIILSAMIIVLALVSMSNIELFDSVVDVLGYSTELARKYGDDGASPLRVMVSAVPLLLAFYSHDAMQEENDEIISIFVNMSIVTLCVGMLATVTSGIMTGRMLIYTEIYNLILLPHVINLCFEGSNRTVIMFTAIFFYFLYFYVQWGR